MANGYGSDQVRSLINLYRANPNLFDEEHLETLEQMASQQGVNFKPIKDTTTLGSLAKNFSGGFIRGLVPLVPPDDQPRTTYEAIARSLGHLAGFAPSILSLPLRGATIAAKGVAGALGRKATKEALETKLKRGSFYGDKAVGVLDKLSLPMIGSRYIKGKMGHAITKLELDTLDYMKAGGVSRAIAEEAVGLGTASVISDIWSGPDDYMNVFLGGALAGGVFGGIGNWRALGNRLGAAKTETQRKGVESALKAAVGSAFMGVPSTLRREPIEMQMYEYLLGGFFGYQSRPAHEVAGGQFYQSLPTDRPTLSFRPEQVPGFHPEAVPTDPAGRGGLSKKAQKYVMDRATENSEKWLGHNIENWQDMLSARLKNNPKGKDLDVVEAETRSLAEDLYIRTAFQEAVIKAQGEPVADDRVDPFDPFDVPEFTRNVMAQKIHDTLVNRHASRSEKDAEGNSKRKPYTGKNPEEIAIELDEISKRYSKDVDGNQRSSADVEGFITEISGTEFGKRYLEENPREGITNLRQYFHQDKPYVDRLALDLTGDLMGIKVVRGGDTIVMTKPNGKEIQTIGGEKLYNQPILDTFGAGRGFEFIKYIKEGDNKYSDINKYLPGENTFDLDMNQRTQMEQSLQNYNDGYYWYAGKKDNKSIIVAPFKDRIPSARLRDQLGYENYTIKDMARESGKNRKELLDVFKDSEAAYIENTDRGVMKEPDAKKLHERQFVSNMVHELMNQYGSPSLHRLSEITDPKFFKDAVDFNKRQQLFAESSGVPLNQNSFKDPKYGNVKNNRVNFLILRDGDFNLSGNPGGSGADGGLLFGKNFFRGIRNAMGIDTAITTIKPVTVGRLLERNGVNVGGIIGLKSDGVNANSRPAMQDIMDKYKALDGSDIHFVAFESSNKIKGNTEATKFNFNETTGKYEIDGNLEVHTLPLEAVRINLGTIDDATKNFKGINLPRQFLSTLNFGQVGKFLKPITDYYTEHAFSGTIKGGKLVEEYNKTGNIKPIEDWLVDNYKNLDALPLEFVAERLLDPNPESNVFRRALQKDAASLDHQIESFQIDADSMWNHYHSTITSLGRLTDGSFAPLNFFEKLSRPYQNSLRKHVMKRITTPFWEYSGKGALDPVTKDMFLGADMRSDITTESFAKSNEYILLGTAHKKMNAKLNLEEAQIKELRKFLKKGQKIEDNGNTTLGTLWHLHKNARQQVSNTSKEGLENALDLLIIRVPADSISGTIPVKLGGFTKDKGTGIVTTELQDKYLGGADKDIDSAFIIQNGSREHRKILEKHKFDREKLDENQLIKDLGAKDPDRRAATKFSPVYRRQAHEVGLQGAGTRGPVIAARDYFLDLAGRLKSGEKYKFNYTDPKSKQVTSYEIVLRPGKGNYKKFLNNIYGSINIANDSTKYSYIPTMEMVRNRLFDSIFEVRVGHPDGKSSKMNASEFYEHTKYHKKDLSRFKMDAAFFAEFKTSVYNEESKSLNSFLTLGDKYGHSADKYSSASGRQFSRLLDEKIIDTMRVFQDEAMLKDYSNQIKNSAENFIIIHDKDTAAVKKQKNKEHDFVSKFLPEWRIILNPQSQKLEPRVDRFGRTWKTTLDAINEDLSVNLNKGASYELLTEKGLQVLRSFSKAKQDSPNANSKIINTILKNAYEKAQEHLEVLTKVKAVDRHKPYKYKEQEMQRSEAFDFMVKDYQKLIMAKAKENSINVRPLMDFYELSLLTPKELGQSGFFRQDSVVWGSEAISQNSKALVLKKMSEIFNRSYDFEKAPEVEPKISKKLSKIEPNLRTELIDYAKDLKQNTENIKDIYVIGSVAEKGKGKDIDILYDMGKIKIPEHILRAEMEGEPALSEYIGENIAPNFNSIKYDNFVKIRDQNNDIHYYYSGQITQTSELPKILTSSAKLKDIEKNRVSLLEEAPDKPVSELVALSQRMQEAQLGKIERITETPDYADLISFADKAHATTEKVADKVKDKKLKTDDMWNLERLAASDAEAKEIIDLRDTLLKHPQINDSFNEFFIDFTTRRGNPRDLTLMSMDDVRALNSHFRDVSKFSLKDIMLRRNWLLDPRDIDQGQLHETINRYESYIQDVRSLDRKTGKPVTIKQKASTFMTPLGRMREMFRKSQVQQNAETDPIRKEVLNELGYTKWMEQNDKRILTELVSNRRNIEEERLTGKEYTDFLSRLIKNPVTKQTKTGKEWLNIYDKKITEFYDKVAKEWLFTYDKNGERIIFRDLIDFPETGDPKYGKITEYIRYDPQTAKFNFRHFREKVIDPMEKVGQSPKIGMESLMRYQWEASMEKFLAKKAGGIDKITKEQREQYRRIHKFEEEYGFGYIEPEQYWSRTNYGFNNKARKKLEASIKKAAQAAADAETNPRAKEEAYKRVMAKHGMLREDSYHPSMGLEKQFLNDNYDAVGYGARPQNLLQRGKDFIDGYDTSPEIFHRYKNQVVRSYFSNISAIHGNRQIGILKYGKEIPNLKEVNADLVKHNKAIDKEATKLSKKFLKEGGSNEGARLMREEYKERHKYKDNADMWSDFLYVYLKNSLGHPSLLTDRIVKSMETADPLKLKYNPYYLTSDYAVTRAMEKLYKSKKFNKMPFLRNAPENEAMRRDYFVRRLHDLGTMEARYNLLTLLANTGTMMTNLYGGGVTTMGSAGFKTWADSQRNSKVVNKLLIDVNGDYTLTFKSGKSVKTRKDLIKWIEEKGVIDSYIQNELDYNPGMGTAIAKLGKDGKAFVRDLKRSIKTGAEDETILQLSKRYGISDAMLRYGGWFMQVSERKNRVDAFISHALKAKERLGSEGIHTNLNDPYIFDMALKGIETTQFLYHSAFRPAFMTTAMGKVLTRFKLFAFQSVRVRREFYKQAKSYGFKEGTDEYNKLKDLFLTDLFSFALGGAFMYSVFDTALPPPWDWMQDAGDLMFGDKKERDRAFYGTLPRPIAPLQAVLPPIARFPQTFVELVQGDWEKFSNYTIHTMYPGGRLYYSAKKTAERPDNFWQNFFRIPVSKIKYRIDREKIREARREMIGEEL